MNYQLKNMTRRPISILCNSGKTYHLPPRYCLEVSRTEVDNNAFINKLRDRKVVDVSRGAGKEEKKPDTKAAARAPKKPAAKATRK